MDWSWDTPIYSAVCWDHHITWPCAVSGCGFTWPLPFGKAIHWKTSTYWAMMLGALNSRQRAVVQDLINMWHPYVLFEDIFSALTARPGTLCPNYCQPYCGRPWIWGWQNCTSRAQKLEPHLLVKVHSASAPWLNHCRSQCNIRLGQLKLIL